MNKQVHLFVLLLMISASSQSQIRYAAKAGFGWSRVSETPSSQFRDYRAKTGYLAGMFAEKKLIGHLYLQAGIQLTQKGFVAEEGKPSGPFYWYRNVSMTYSEFPVNAVFHVRITGNLDWLFGAGPVVAIGIWDKTRYIASITDDRGVVTTSSGTSRSTFGGGDVQRFDFGGQLLSGIQINKIQLTAGYNYGLLNTRASGKDLQSLRHRNVAMALSLFL